VTGRQEQPGLARHRRWTRDDYAEPAGQNNGIDAASAEHLDLLVEQIASTVGVRVVLLRGNGPRFCGGADLNWLRLGEAGASGRINRMLRDLNA